VVGVLSQSTPLSHCEGGGHRGGVVHAVTSAQVVSHWHEFEQSMPSRQVAVLLHSTLHWPVPHVMPNQHESDAVQLMSQLVALEQSMPPLQEFLPLHSTRQSMPDGQTT
jgi:hypothetical protein